MSNFQGKFWVWRAALQVGVILLLRILDFEFLGSSVGLEQVLAFDHQVLLLPENDKAQTANAIPALIFLGDSTVDAGVNNYLDTPIRCNWPPYGRDFPTKQPTGRFGNGKLIGDYLADRLGLPYPLPYLDPNANGTALLHGINVASSASGFYDMTARLVNVKTLPQQINWVKDWKARVAKLVGMSTAELITSQALFVISAGSNDWINNYFVYPLIRLEFNVTEFRNILLENAQQRLQDLYNLGARKIAVVSAPPLGCLPAQVYQSNNHTQCIKSSNDIALAFNVGLRNTIDSLQASMPDITLVYVDAYNLLLDAISNPAKYGITEPNIFRTCCDNGLGGPPAALSCNRFSPACENADALLFWDGYHPGQAFNRQAADILYNSLALAMGFRV